MNRVAWGLAVTVASLAVIGGAGAGAATKTTVTIKAHPGPATVDGKVKSEDGDCKAGREVHLYWDEPGSPKFFEDVDDTTAESNGDWEIDAPGDTIPPGKYYAKAAKIGPCGGAKSETIKVKP